MKLIRIPVALALVLAVVVEVALKGKPHPSQ